MTDASPALPPARQVEPGTRRMMILAGVLNLIVATLILIIVAMATAMMDAGKGGGAEALGPLAVYFGAPVGAYYLYTGTRIDIRWIAVLLWLPLIAAIAGILLIMNYA